MSGIISRADLAELSIELVLDTTNSKNLQNTAMEAYYTKGLLPVEGQFKKFVDDNNGVIEHVRGSTYQELFQQIRPNYDYYNEA